MKAVFTVSALEDLDRIRRYIAANYPELSALVGKRIHAVIGRIVAYPESARTVAGWSHFHVVPVIRYPYKIFYRIIGETVEILHIHHTSRER